MDNLTAQANDPDLRQHLATDQRLRSPDADKLGVAPLAKHVADSIAALPHGPGLVAAIYGPWGVGKSTFMEFVRSYLNTEPDERMLLDFNPWWFSGEEELTRRFFEQLSATIQRKAPGTTDSQKWIAVASNLADLAVLASKVTPYGSYVDIARTAIGKLILKPRQPVQSQRDIQLVRSEIVSQLRELDQQVVVFIDDVDRLTSEEIRQLFKLVKTIGDFPNVVYLLALDKTVAIEALSEAQAGLDGHDYLEKIVQASFELPMPDPLALRALLVGELIDLVGEERLEAVPGRWDELFPRIQAFIETPRQVTLLMNALRLSFPLVADEVCAPDFVAIQALRVFSPEAYEVLRREPDAFVGSPDPNVNPAYHTQWLDEMRDPRERARVQNLLSTLFPALAFGLDRSQQRLRTEISMAQRRARCVSVAEWFDNYFRLALASEAVSQRELGSILALAGDQAAFARRLEELASERRGDGTSRATEVLFLLRDYVDIPPLRDYAHQVVGALLSAGNAFLGPTTPVQRLASLDPDIFVSQLLYALLPQLSESQRATFFANAIGSDGSFASAIIQVGRLSDAAQERPDDPGLMLTGEALGGVTSWAAHRCRTLADQRKLLHQPELLHILYRWHAWTENPNEIDEWLARLADQDGLLPFLRMWYDGLGGWNIGELARIADISTLRGVLGRYASSQQLSQDDRILLSAAERACEVWITRAPAPDPDSPGSQESRPA